MFPLSLVFPCLSGKIVYYTIKAAFAVYLLAMKERFEILLIEDDEDDAEMTIYTLSKLSDVNIKHINDGQDAIRYLLDENLTMPDVILLDLKMPKVDGIDVLKRIQAHPERKSIPVIAFVSSSQGRAYVESFQLSTNGYLMKPVEITSFLTALTEAGLGGFNVNVTERHKQKAGM